MKKIYQILQELEYREPGNMYNFQIYSDGAIRIENDTNVIYEFGSYQQCIDYFEKEKFI